MVKCLIVQVLSKSHFPLELKETFVSWHCGFWLLKLLHVLLLSENKSQQEKEKTWGFDVLSFCLLLRHIRALL